MRKTASGLAEYCRSQLGKPYWWGTFGQRATAALLAEKRAQYPGYYTASDFTAQLGQRVHDCVGLVKGYLWSETPSSTPVYTPAQDVNVPMLYNRCTRRGTLRTMPDVPGVCVFMASMGHVGVYVGDGAVIEARGHAFGVVKTKLTERGWALWGMPDWITYEGPLQSADADSSPRGGAGISVQAVELRRGCQGSPVKKLQILLNGLGYSCGQVDGDFGEKTEWAVRSYQVHFGLENDGVAGAQTWGSLLG